MELATRIAVIGLGTMGSTHAMNLMGGIPGATLAAVADPYVDSLPLSFLGQQPVAIFSDYRRLLEEDGWDALIIASSSTTHGEVLRMAAEAGKPVFCEKPLALSLQDSLDIHRLYASRHIPLHMGFMRRFDPHYMQAKQLIDGGRIGRPYHYYGLSRDRIGPAVGTARESGGFYLDTGVHEFDMARWLMGSEIVSVFARGELYNHPDYAEFHDVDQTHLSFRCASGSLGITELSRDAIYGYEIRTEVLGTEGAIQVAPVNRTGTALLIDGQVIRDTFKDYRERFREAYLNEIQDFVQCVREGRPPMVGSGDGIRATVIAEAGIRSLQSGRDEEVVYPD